MSRKQTRDELEGLYAKEDPWGFRTNPDDLYRRGRIVAAVEAEFSKLNGTAKLGKLLDLGCGEGFITEVMPGQHIVAVDVAPSACERAAIRLTEEITIKRGAAVNVLCLDVYEDMGPVVAGAPYDVVLATGLLYGASEDEVERMTHLVRGGGLFLSCHISSRPYCAAYLRRPPQGFSIVRYETFPYRQFEEELIVLRRGS